MRILLLTLFITFPFVASSQTEVKEEFQQELQLAKEKNEFKQKLLLLDTINKKGLNLLKLDSLKSSGKFEFIELKNNTKGKQLVLNLPQYLATFYLQFEKTGLVNHLKSLRALGDLKVPSRSIASDIEPPRKINKNQSYSDFYLEVIQKIINSNKALLSADQLDFETYRQWEKAGNLIKESDLAGYRLNFILFLCRRYNIRY